MSVADNSSLSLLRSVHLRKCSSGETPSDGGVKTTNVQFQCWVQVNRRNKIEIYPRAPKFEVSEPMIVKAGQAKHRLVYGPFKSDKHRHSLFPYAAKAGNTFYNQGYDFFLASNSRVMNPLYQPKTSDNRDARTDYFSKQRSQNQKSAVSLQSMQLEEMCGVKLSDVPKQFEELKDLLNDLRVRKKE